MHVLESVSYQATVVIYSSVAAEGRSFEILAKNGVRSARNVCLTKLKAQSGIETALSGPHRAKLTHELTFRRPFIDP